MCSSTFIRQFIIYTVFFFFGPILFITFFLFFPNYFVCNTNDPSTGLPSEPCCVDQLTNYLGGLNLAGSSRKIEPNHGLVQIQSNKSAGPVKIPKTLGIKSAKWPPYRAKGVSWSQNPENLQKIWKTQGLICKIEQHKLITRSICSPKNNKKC